MGRFQLSVPDQGAVMELQRALKLKSDQAALQVLMPRIV